MEKRSSMRGRKRVSLLQDEVEVMMGTEDEGDVCRPDEEKG